MTPTAQQAAFLTALTTTTSHLALVARAGCGKTSTILLGVDALQKTSPNLEVLVCAFNKAIADEVAAKLKKAGHTDWKKVQASTLHAMGFGLLKFAFNPTVDDKKVIKIVDARNDDISRQYAAQIVSLVAYAKQAAVGFFPDKPIGNVQVWHDLADHFDINGLDDTSQSDEIVEVAQQVYRQSLADTSVIDYSDMVLMPLIKNIRVKFGKDIIFLDEAQDLSPARQALARKFLKPHTGRMVIVGDPAQAIYGFTGASPEALQDMIDALGAKEFPLSVTWRCPKTVVALAQKLVPDIEAAPSAPEGEVLYVDALPDDIGASDAILCRNTAPLISIAYKLIRAGKPCKVEGRSIGEGLQVLVRRWKVSTVAALTTRLEDHRDREVQKAQAKGNDQKAEEIEDKVTTLLEICQAVQAKGLQSVSDVSAFINDLFADGATGVTTLASLHKSKGREWDRVFLWEHSSRCPSKYARQPWQLTAERNLSYVGLTRAIKTLVFVN